MFSGKLCVLAAEQPLWGGCSLTRTCPCLVPCFKYVVVC